MTQHFSLTRRSVLGGAMGLVVTGAISKPAFAAETIRIGANLALSGPNGANGEICRAGIEMQREAINSRGGLLGRTVEILYRDHGGVPAEALTNTRELIERENVVAFVGEVGSGPALAVGPIIGAAGLPWIIGTATNTTLTERPENSTAYRVATPDAAMADRAVSEALKRSNKIALITDTSGYGQGGHKDLLAALTAKNVEPVADQTYTPNAADMTAQISTIRDAGAEAVIMWSIAPDAAQIVRTMKRLRLDVPVIGGWGLEGPTFLSLAGDAAEGVLILSFDPFDEDTPVVADFLKRFEQKFGTKTIEGPSYLAVNYDAMGLLAAAIEKAGSSEPADVLKALPEASYSGLIRDYDKPWADGNRNALRAEDMYLRVIKDGKSVPFEN